MNKKLLAALSGGAALLIALSGCGDSEQKADAYADRLCDDLQPQLEKKEAANKALASPVEEAKPADVKKTDAAAFQQIADAYAAMADTVENAGIPPVDGGEQMQKNTARKLDATSEAYADLKTAVDQLDTKDQAKFAEGLKDLAEEEGRVERSAPSLCGSTSTAKQ